MALLYHIIKPTDKPSFPGISQSQFSNSILHGSDFETRSFGRGVCWEVCFAFRSKFQPAFNCCRHCPAVPPYQPFACSRLADSGIFGLCHVASGNGMTMWAENTRYRPRWRWSPAHWHEKYNPARRVTHPAVRGLQNTSDVRGLRVNGNVHNTVPKPTRESGSGHCRTVSLIQCKSGEESAGEPRSKPPSTLPAQNSVFQNQNSEV